MYSPKIPDPVQGVIHILPIHKINIQALPFPGPQQENTAIPGYSPTGFPTSASTP